MDFDLQRALRGLGSEPPAAATTLPVDEMLRRAHRRRATRMVAFSAVGATTAGALVLGGIAVAGRAVPAPVPPVIVPTQPTAPPTHTPVPTPSVTEPTASDAAYSPDLSACGRVLTYDTQASTGPSGSYVYATDTTDNALGGPITATFQVGAESMQVGERVSLTVLDAPLTTYDPTSDTYTVVGVPAAPLPPAAARQLDTPSSEVGGIGVELTLGLTSPYVMCEGRPDAGGPPSEAEYAVWTHVELVHGNATLTSWGYAPVLVGNPPAWQPPAPAPGDLSTLPPVDVAWLRQSVGLPGCGDSFSPTTDTASAPSDWWAIDATAALEGASIRVSVTGTRVGAGVDGAALGPVVSITKDGVVVAQSDVGYEVPWIVGPMAVGASVTKTVVLDAVTCIDLGVDHPVGSALPPGTYQVWAEEEIGDVTVVDGVAQGGWGPHRGGPWQLVVP